MKTLEDKPLEQNTENWKRENWLFTSTVLGAGASGQNRMVRTHSEVIEQFDSFSLLKLLFLVRNWHCWSRKAFLAKWHPEAEKKLRRRPFFDSTDRHEKLYGRSRLYASAQGRHELRSVKACLEVSAIRNVWAAASRAIVQWKNGACLIEDSDGSIRVSGEPGFPPPVWTQGAKLVRMREAANNCCCLLSFFFAV